MRWRLAWMTFLNPDEALHYLLSRQPSLPLAYQASLLTAHPPLMILFLNEWGRLGTSEPFLRLPFVCAGVFFSWIMFLWVRQISNHRAAFYSLALFLYLPSLVSLSAEIRQYSFLLLFAASSLYALERALREGSAPWLAFSMAALYLALLTHYSALIFAAGVAAYGLLRLLGTGRGPALMTIWLGGQAGAVALCLFLFHTQVSGLRQTGLPSEIARTWLRSSIFQTGEDRLPSFAWSHTVRLFRYFFSHGTIGVLALALFLCALVLLLSARHSKIPKREQRPLALFWVLPLLLALGAARAGIYPYGGTRHDAILVLFAIPSVGLALDWLNVKLRARWRWSAPILLTVALLIVNRFPSPSGPYIRPRNQSRQLMAEAMGFFNSLPTNSVLFTDHQGSLVLGYYLCGKTEPAANSTESLALAGCGRYRLLWATGEEAFDRAVFPGFVEDAWHKIPGETTLYLFQSGWIDDKEQAWLAELGNLGGDPRNFGPNILVCPIAKSR